MFFIKFSSRNFNVFCFGGFTLRSNKSKYWEMIRYFVYGCLAHDKYSMPAMSKLQYYFSSVHEKCAGWLERLSYQVTVLVYGNREGTPSQSGTRLPPWSHSDSDKIGIPDHVY